MKCIEQFFGNSALHDFEMGEIEVNYSEGTILFHFITPKQQSADYLVKKFTSLSFKKNEEWGEGKYVVSSSVSCDDGIWTIKIQLNSGDTCLVKCCDSDSFKQ